MDTQELYSYKPFCLGTNIGKGKYGAEKTQNKMTCQGHF